MKWSFSKNVLIILLILLNILMFAVRYTSRNNAYTLHSENEQNIRNILYDHNFLLYTLLPTEFYPLRPLEGTFESVDGEDIANFYFADRNYEKKTEGTKDIYYKDANTYVEVYRNGKVVYYEGLSKGSPELSDGEIDKDEAYEMLTTFYRKIYKGDRTYKAEGYDKEAGVYKYYYYNQYKDTYVFNDYVKIQIYLDHIEAESWKVNVKPSSDKTNDLIPVDEALFNFVKNVKIETEESIYVTDIALGYYAINDLLATDEKVVEYPYYKISIKHNGDFYINAYTNEIYNSKLELIDNTDVTNE